MGTLLLALTACNSPFTSTPATTTTRSNVLNLTFSQPGERTTFTALKTETEVKVEGGPTVTLGPKTARIVFAETASSGQQAEVFVWRGGNITALTREIVAATRSSGWFVVFGSGFLFTKADTAVSGVVSDAMPELLVAVFCR